MMAKRNTRKVVVVRLLVVMPISNPVTTNADVARFCRPNAQRSPAAAQDRTSDRLVQRVLGGLTNT
jgi:hypothetical protein